MLNRTVGAAQYPADVSPKGIFDYWRMNVFRLVGVLMMVAVVRGPPHGAKLSRRCADPSHNELKDSASLERAMREVSMEASRQSEHSHHVCNR